MFSETETTKIQEDTTITQAAQALQCAVAEGLPFVALPSDFQAHNLERFMPRRRRARGEMDTTALQDFAAYATACAENGAAVFIDVPAMKARAILNLGTPDAPGHADHAAVLSPRQTAAYRGLLARIDKGLGQQTAAEFLEDWADCIQCFAKDKEISTPRAIAAVRRITIEAMSKQENEEQNLSVSRSTFESVTASSKEPLPTHINFKCQPYPDLAERTFVLRISLRTGDNKPMLVFRLMKQELHEQEMAQELCSLIKESFSKDKLPVYLGVFTPKN